MSILKLFKREQLSTHIKKINIKRIKRNKNTLSIIVNSIIFNYSNHDNKGIDNLLKIEFTLVNKSIGNYSIDYIKVLDLKSLDDGNHENNYN